MMFIPTPETFLCAVIKGYFASWPELTIYLIYKHPAKALATNMVHIHMQQKNIKDNKLKKDVPLEESTNFRRIIREESTNFRGLI